MGAREIPTEAAYVRIRPHTSAYVAYARIRRVRRIPGRMVFTREPEREDAPTHAAAGKEEK